MEVVKKIFILLALTCLTSCYYRSPYHIKIERRFNPNYRHVEDITVGLEIELDHVAICYQYDVKAYIFIRNKTDQEYYLDKSRFIIPIDTTPGYRPIQAVPRSRRELVHISPYSEKVITEDYRIRNIEVGDCVYLKYVGIVYDKRAKSRLAQINSGYLDFYCIK